jgi:hypothetical protein
MTIKSDAPLEAFPSLMLIALVRAPRLPLGLFIRVIDTQVVVAASARRWVRKVSITPIRNFHLTLFEMSENNGAPERSPMSRFNDS